MRILIIFILISSCRAPEVLRDKAKAQKLLSKIERLDPSALSYFSDTIYEYLYIEDTVFVESRKYDTSFVFVPGDTVTLTDTVSRIVTKIIFKEGAASLSLTIPRDTILIYDTIQVPVAVHHSIEIQKKPWHGILLSLWRRFNWLLAIAALVLVGIWVSRRI